MQPTINNDWNNFAQHVSALYPEQINNLKKLTRDHLKAGKNEQKARFIKVAYVDYYKEPSTSDIHDLKNTPRVVLWEAHPKVQGLDLRWKQHITNVGSLKKSLRDSELPKNLSYMQTEFYFASTQLRNRGTHTDENLRLYLIFYCDKIYAMPLPQSNNETWQKYKDYFNKAQSMVLANPALYTELCRKLKGLFIDSIEGPLEDEVYRYLVLLRSLPETLAYSSNDHIAAEESVRELLGLLDEKSYKLAIRLEAAWALGWASVSSIAVATCVLRGERSPKSRINRLNNNVLKQVAGIAYLRASFTLVSFGPARATPGAEKMIPPGGYLHPEQSLLQNQVFSGDYARQAASDVVYHELASLIRGNIQFLSVLTALAAIWLVINTLIATLLLPDTHLAVVACLSIPPTIFLLLTVTILTNQLGKAYWKRLVIIWIMGLILVASPWVGIINKQLLFIIVGAFAALLGASAGPISSWVTLITGIPAMFTMIKMFRSRQRSLHK